MAIDHHHRRIAFGVAGAVLIISLVVLIRFQSASEKATVGAINPDTSILAEWMSSVGQRLRCHFTFEAFDSDTSSSSLELLFSTRITNDPSVTNVMRLIKKLQADIPGCNIYADQKLTNVIRLVDKRLLLLKDYSLNKVIDLSYAGELGGAASGRSLIQELSRQLPSIIDPPHVVIGPIRVSDGLTKVNIQAKDETVRRIITDCLPLDTYNTFLWSATTTMSSKTNRTTIFFFGPEKL